MGLIIGYCIASICTGMFFKILLSAIFKKYLQISSVLNLFEYHFIRRHDPRDLIQGLTISCRIVSGVNGMVINVLMTPALAIFLRFFFNFSENYLVPSFWIFMSQ